MNVLNWINLSSFSSHFLFEPHQWVGNLPRNYPRLSRTPTRQSRHKLGLQCPGGLPRRLRSPTPCRSCHGWWRPTPDLQPRWDWPQLHHSTIYVQERGWVVLHLIGKVLPLHHHKSKMKVLNWINLSSFSSHFLFEHAFSSQKCYIAAYLECCSERMVEEFFQDQTLEWHGLCHIFSVKSDDELLLLFLW